MPSTWAAIACRITVAAAVGSALPSWIVTSQPSASPAALNAFACTTHASNAWPHERYQTFLPLTAAGPSAGGSS